MVYGVLGKDDYEAGAGFTCREVYWSGGVYEGACFQGNILAMNNNTFLVTKEKKTEVHSL
jgi:hypothetical protein